MKFLCVRCSQQMSLTDTSADDQGSLAIRFSCPTCDHQFSMLTNPSETQVVSSLGVKLGRNGSQKSSEAGGCPFGDVVREMGLGAEDDGGMTWTSTAAERLSNIPELVRPMAKQGIEHFARSNGYSEIDLAVLEKARKQFGM